MESKASKGSLYINRDSSPIVEIYFLDKDRDVLRSLLCSTYSVWSLVPEPIHFPDVVPGPLEFCKTQDFQFIFRLCDKEYQGEDLKLKIPWRWARNHLGWWRNLRIIN